MPANSEPEIHNKPQEQLNEAQRLQVRKAVNLGISQYIASRKAKVPGFVDQYFSFQGACKIHRKALGKDLFKAPLNIVWLLPYTLATGFSKLFHKAGTKRLAAMLDKVPPGFETDVQKEINWLIYTELLELPYQQHERESTKDALLAAIFQEAELDRIINSHLQKIHQKSLLPGYKKTLEKNLQQYLHSRTAAAELSGNLITLSSSYLAFHKAMPGAISTGGITAAAIAEKMAIANFWLGSTAGAWYYSLFPVSASAGLVVASTGAIMAGLALITTFTGIVTDPLQAKLGLHQKRLDKFLDALEAKLNDNGESSYTIKEHYIARIFDFLDLLMKASSS